MISVLFAARDSVYKTLPGLDVWDEDRDALKWPGGNPGIFHPPCRLWSRLAHFSTAPESEKELALWSVSQVRQWGGILEHPAFSQLWYAAELPFPDKTGSDGFTIAIDQFWFGHRSRKPTWLYICGVSKGNLPPAPFRLAGYYEDVFAGGSRKYVPGSRHGALRSGTPIEFAKWLIKAVENCREPAEGFFG
jgi:hypothetical protein